MEERHRALLVANGALVFMVGLIAGFPFTFVILGKIVLWPLPGALEVHVPGEVRAWRMAHLEGILNGLTLNAVAAVVPWLVLGRRTQRALAWLLIVTAWGNIVPSVIGPLFGGRGLEFGGSAANSVMYVLFVAAVVAVLVAMVLVFVGALRRARVASLAAGDAKTARPG